MSHKYSKGKEKVGYYPTQWSKWEWDETSQQVKRYRLRAPDDYEIEYAGPSESSCKIENCSTFKYFVLTTQSSV